MRQRDVVLLALLGLTAAALVAVLQYSPGYMDADYYYLGARQLVNGSGFNEMILWNYLDDPAGIPHPSHGYWMPLTSLMAAVGLLGAGESSFAAARLPFLLLAAVLPVLAASLSRAVSGENRHALLAGLLAAFPGFYLAYLPTTDSFGLYMLFGGMFLLLGGWPYRLGLRSAGESPSLRKMAAAALVLGVLAGAMHLTRADGLLWLVMALGWAAVTSREMFPAGKRLRNLAVFLFLIVLGYLAVMGAWMLRNLSVFGTPLAPGGARALWLTDYDELFIYPAGELTPNRWWAAGIGRILEARIWALGLNLQTALAVQGQVFLLPLILVGIWRLRSSPTVRFGAVAWLLTFAAMTLVFPYQGARGGFFHSGAALQPLWFAVAPAGLDALVAWGSRMRGWKPAEAWRVFAAGLILLALGMTVFLAFLRVIGSEPENRLWNQDWRRYRAVETVLTQYGSLPDTMVMVYNAPAYQAATGRPAISIPYGGAGAVIAAAQRYGADYLLIEQEQVQGERLFGDPGNRSGLRYLDTVAEVRLYEITAP